MIEGPTAVVIFDGQLLLPYAAKVASYVQTLGKPSIGSFFRTRIPITGPVFRF